jgi:hypothetical protein
VDAVATGTPTLQLEPGSVEEPSPPPSD